MGLNQLPPDASLPGDRVHRGAGVPRVLNVLGVGESEQDLADTLLGQGGHQGLPAGVAAVVVAGRVGGG